MHTVDIAAPPRKRWQAKPYNQEVALELAEALNGKKLLSQLLVQRSIKGFDQAKDYFNPSAENLHDPFSMKDMHLAVERIQKAIDRQEKILIYGDYDVDGTTSVALMVQFFRSFYPLHLLDFYIPNRYREGYGVSQAGINFAVNNGFTLLITLDCGIKSVELIEQAKSRGVETIICDHHLPDATLPPAIAILNPKQADCPYPYKDLCGCGIGYKLACALRQSILPPQQSDDEFLDLVATAIAADIVPMTGENRILASLGLRKINQDPSPAIKALVKLGKAVYPLSITDVVFIIAPRINAAGRMDDARKAVELFLQTQEEAALELAESLHADNTERKEADAQITAEALDKIKNDTTHQYRKTTVVFGRHWKKGVVGIVASRLIEHHYRPTIVLAEHEGIITGSARSIPGFNLYEAIHACREHLLGYGGHFAAAGLSLLPNQLNAFEQRFEEVVASILPDEMLIPVLTFDSTARLTDFTPALYKQLCRMEPFGPENMRPVFRLSGARVCTGTRVVKEHHVRFVLEQDNVGITGIGFGLAQQAGILTAGAAIDLLCTLDENTWNNQTSLQLRVIDFRLANDCNES